MLTIPYKYQYGFYHVLHDIGNTVQQELRRTQSYALSGSGGERVYKATLISIKLLQNEPLAERDLEILEENRLHYLDGKEFSKIIWFWSLLKKYITITQAVTSAAFFYFFLQALVHTLETQSQKHIL